MISMQTAGVKLWTDGEATRVAKSTNPSYGLGSPELAARWMVVAVFSLAVYVAMFGAIDLLGFGHAFADDDPFTYAAGKAQTLGTGFMLLIRVIMVFAIIGVCGYAWFKGGKVSPAMIVIMVIAGFIGIKADLVVKMFGTTNPFTSIN